MKRGVRKIVAISLFLLLLSACGEADPEVSEPEVSPPDVSEPEAVSRVTDLIPNLLEPEGVYVISGAPCYSFAGPNTFSPADDERAQQIVELLDTLDMSQYRELEKDAPFAGGVLGFRIFDGSQTAYLQIDSFGEDASRIAFRCMDGLQLFDFQTPGNIQEPEYRVFEGPLNRELFNKLNQLQTEVTASDTGEGVAQIRQLQSGGKSWSLIKLYSGSLMNGLEGSAHQATYDGDDYSFDLEVQVMDIVYQIDSQTGVFSREEGGTTTLHRMDDNTLRKFLHRMGLFS